MEQKQEELSDKITRLTSNVDQQLAALDLKVKKLKRLNVNDRDFASFKKQSADISTDFGKLKTGFDDLKANKEFVDVPEVIRKNLLEKYTARFGMVVNEFTQLADGYKKKHNEAQASRLRSTVGDQISEDQISTIIESGKMDQVVRSALMADDLDNLKDFIDDLEDRQDKIRELETSVLEVAQLFRDFQLLVETQQDALDSITVHIEKSHGHVIKAEKEIVAARKYAKSTRGMMCCCFWCVVVIAAIIVSTTMLTSIGDA